MSPLFFFILLFSIQVHSFPFPDDFNVVYWYSYEGFKLDWRPQQNSASNVKTASLPSHISPSLKSLDAEEDGSYSIGIGPVWGLWDYGTGRSSLSYQLNITERIFSPLMYCGLYNVKVAVKFYSESSNQIYISNCAEQNKGHGGYCTMRPSNSGGNPTWTTQTRRMDVDSSNEVLDLKLYAFNGKPLIIESVSLLFQRNETCPNPSL